MTHRALRLFTPLLVLVSLTAMIAAVIPNLTPFQDQTGAVATFNSSGAIDPSGAFFQSLGTNGRSCATCHRLDQAMSLSSRGVQSIYRQSHGHDPLFAAADGANCPMDDVSNRASHSLLLDRGLIRVGLPIPSDPEFSISVVHDPYGCAIIHDPNTGADIISVYRRPLPSTNLRFLSTVMFDGRETILPSTSGSTFHANLEADLKKQAFDAIMGHAQATSEPTDAQLNEIVHLELRLTTAQVMGRGAGMLCKHGASGGPLALAERSAGGTRLDRLA